MRYLITGGTGFLGQHLTRHLLDQADTELIRIFSRDEYKQSQMRDRFSEESKAGGRLRFLLGDVRNKHRVEKAMHDVDVVIHAAALKRIEASEYDPGEFVDTNITGTANVIDAAVKRDVQRLLLISSDKACEPVNTYGATKLMAERLVSTARATYGNPATAMGIVRYGNVWGSRGSVAEAFQQQLIKQGYIELTHRLMTRFVIFPHEACRLIHEALIRTHYGEIYLWRLSSVRMIDMARALSDEVRYIGLRPGEKVHEVLMTRYESMRAKRLPAGDKGERTAYLIHPFNRASFFASDWDTSFELSSEVAMRYEPLSDLVDWKVRGELPIDAEVI